MSENKFTEGEWRYDVENSVISSGDDLIGKVINYDIEGAANGYLIAAAPDLLAACEEALVKFAEIVQYGSHFVDDEIILIEKAIAKAKGEMG